MLARCPLRKDLHKVTVFYLAAKDYLSKGWHLFDFVLAFWGFVAFWRAVADDTAAKHIAIPLVIRLSTVFSLVVSDEVSRVMQVLVQAVLRSLPGVFTMFFLILFPLYVFACVGGISYNIKDPRHWDG